MNNIKIAKQTIEISSNGSYEINGKNIKLPDIDYTFVEAYSPERLEQVMNEDISKYFSENKCQYSVTVEDSFQAAHRFENPYVMNFANAHFAGGGFLLGANAQEESLCRCSTLYASLKSDEASKMYSHNNKKIGKSKIESDYMIYTPKVCVFRNEKYELIEEPFLASVITTAAPNKRGTAMLASDTQIGETMTRRIRMLLRIAAIKGHKNLVLGAWGCGAFGNNPIKVSGYFYNVLEDEQYKKCFDNICFAIYGDVDSKNYKAFSMNFC